jgi:polyisoprenoid-binding protein YceI
VTVTIPLSALSTGAPDLDDDFRSADFFELAKFPRATFKSTKVEKIGESGRLKVSGNLNLSRGFGRVLRRSRVNRIVIDDRPASSAS